MKNIIKLLTFSLVTFGLTNQTKASNANCTKENTTWTCLVPGNTVLTIGEKKITIPLGKAIFGQMGSGMGFDFNTSEAISIQEAQQGLKSFINHKLLKNTPLTEIPAKKGIVTWKIGKNVKSLKPLDTDFFIFEGVVF